MLLTATNGCTRFLLFLCPAEASAAGGSQLAEAHSHSLQMLARSFTFILVRACPPQKQALRAASQLAEADSRYQELEQALREEKGRSAALEVRLASCPSVDLELGCSLGCVSSATGGCRVCRCGMGAV